MKFTATWSGAPPAIGDFLMSTTRPRYAYEITGVREIGTAQVAIDACGDEPKKLELTVRRLEAMNLPDGATVHPWRWDSRAPKQVLR